MNNRKSVTVAISLFAGPQDGSTGQEQCTRAVAGSRLELPLATRMKEGGNMESGVLHAPPSNAPPPPTVAVPARSRRAAARQAAQLAVGANGSDDIVIPPTPAESEDDASTCSSTSGSDGAHALPIGALNSAPPVTGGKLSVPHHSLPSSSTPIASARAGHIWFREVARAPLVARSLPPLLSHTLGSCIAQLPCLSA